MRVGAADRRACAGRDDQREALRSTCEDGGLDIIVDRRSQRAQLLRACQEKVLDPRLLTTQASSWRQIILTTNHRTGLHTGSTGCGCVAKTSGEASGGNRGEFARSATPYVHNPPELPDITLSTLTELAVFAA
jgi:hypothetical protein